ncbi:MAG: Trigger factor [Fimbriimonadaceae bacterium]|nr:Trigger factor [Fimbriimonadaceae bacterium]
MNRLWILAIFGPLALLQGCSSDEPEPGKPEPATTTAGTTSSTSTTASTQNSGNTEPKTDAKVKITDVKEGTGKPAADGDLLLVLYQGKLKNGTEFDSNYGKDGKPYAVKLGQPGVIRGWLEGLQGMKVGGIRKLEIPAVLGYGDQDKGIIPPNSDLFFEIKLLDIVPKGEELVYDKKIIKEGNGPVVKKGDTITVHYTGKLVNGFQFDSSAGKEPLTFQLGSGQVISGWEYGIEGLKVGSKCSLRLPPATAYGPGGKGDIPGNQVLLFDIEVLAKQ